MSAPVLSQKDYLKKYLGFGRAPGDKKKKKVKKGASKVKIIDDDANANAITVQDEDEVNEDAPQIVAIIDERPPSMRTDEKTNSHLWQPIGALEDSVSLDSQGRQMLTAFKIEKVDSGLQKVQDGMDIPSSMRKKDKIKAISTDIKVEVTTPPRETEEDCLSLRMSGEDTSPRQQRRDDGDQSPPRKARRDEGDQSPARKVGRIDEGDQSPAKRSRRRGQGDQSPPRRSRRRDEGDQSPPRKSRKSEEGHQSPNKKARRRDKGDQSPARKARSGNENDQSPLRRGRRDELLSHPPRIDGDYPKRAENSEDRRHNDPSTSYKARSHSSSRKSRWEEEPISRLEKEDPSRPVKTLDGKTAGLQNAKELIQETKQSKVREEHYFKTLPKEVSGENAQSIQRDRRTGKVRNFQEEAEAKLKKREAENKQKEKYNRWGKGLAQVESREQKIQEEIYEMSKPLARYADDEDLEKYLKDQDREGDPMLAYIRSKRKKEAVRAGVPLKPRYEGEFMPNRYGLRPGHRWDGVDRSNGYENKWFEVQNTKRAQVEDMYKWSTEDM